MAYSCLAVRIKRVAVSSLKCHWQLVMGSVPQGAIILGLMLFNVLSDLDDELELTLSTCMM